MSNIITALQHDHAIDLLEEAGRITNNYLVANATRHIQAGRTPWTLAQIDHLWEDRMGRVERRLADTYRRAINYRPRVARARRTYARRARGYKRRRTS